VNIGLIVVEIDVDSGAMSRGVVRGDFDDVVVPVVPVVAGVDPGEDDGCVAPDVEPGALESEPCPCSRSVDC
jgi:hypothetical protein